MNLHKIFILIVLFSLLFKVQGTFAAETRPSTIPETLSTEIKMPDNEEIRLEEEIQEDASIAPRIGPKGEVPKGAPMTLNVEDCVQMALLNNREVKAQDYSIEAAKWKLKQAQPRGIPTFEYEFISAPAPRNVDDAVGSFFSGDITYFQRGKIEMGIPVFTFGKINLAQRLAKQGVSAEEIKKIEKQNEVVSRVQRLYYGLLLAKDLLEVLRDAESHLRNEIARREGEETVADPIDLVKIKLFRYEMLSRVDEAEKKEFLAREGLRQMMGLERGTIFRMADEHLRPVDYELKDFDTYLEMARKYRPGVRLLQIGLEAKDLQQQLEKRKLAPDIGVGGIFEFGVTTNSIQGLQLTDDFNDPFNFSRIGFGLRVKGDINIRKYQSEVRQAQAEYFKTAIQKNAADDGLELDLKEGYLDVFQSKKKMQNNYSAMKLARQFVFLTRTNLDIGVGDKKEYSDALQAYLVARGRYLESVFAYNVSVAALKEKVGGVAQLK